MKRNILTSSLIVLAFLAMPGYGAFAQDVNNNNITTGDTSANSTVVNQVNTTTVDCNCTPTPTPAIQDPTPTPTAPPPPSSGGGDGGSSGGSGGQSEPAKAVLGLAATGSGNNEAFEFAQIFGALLLSALGYTFLKRNAH